jgi:hypothetical protein
MAAYLVDARGRYDETPKYLQLMKHIVRRFLGMRSPKSTRMPTSHPIGTGWHLDQKRPSGTPGSAAGSVLPGAVFPREFPFEVRPELLQDVGSHVDAELNPKF